MTTFNKRSEELFKTLHPVLQLTLLKAQVFSPFAFDIPDDGGHRSEKRQLELFQQGRELQRGVWVKVGRTVTNIDGITKKGKHNENPSMAVDLFCNIPGKPDLAFNQVQLCVLAGVMISAFRQLQLEDSSADKYDLVWGGDWDSDGEAIRDQKLIDLPHYELRAV